MFETTHKYLIIKIFIYYKKAKQIKYLFCFCNQQKSYTADKISNVISIKSNSNEYVHGNPNYGYASAFSPFIGGV